MQRLLVAMGDESMTYVLAQIVLKTTSDHPQSEASCLNSALAQTEEVLSITSRSVQQIRSNGVVTVTCLLLGTLVSMFVGCGGTNSHSVTAPPPPQLTLRSIRVASSVQSIPVNGTGQFTATGSYSDGSSKDLTSHAVWTSSSSNIASVSGSGVATGLTNGTTTITATVGPVHGSTSLIVTPILSSITITPLSPSITVNATEQFSATGVWSDGSTQDLTSQVTWASSDNSIASIDNSGLATTLAAGSVTISATSGAISGSASLTITAPTLSAIVVTPDSTAVPIGITQPFSAMGLFSNGSSQQLASVTWTSSNAGVASIDAAGTATTLGTGTVTISATSGSVTGSTSFSVLPAALVSISISPSSPSLALGNTAQLSATGLFTDNGTQTLSGVTWTSSDTTIAAVDNTGFVTTVAPGLVTISATSGTTTGSTTLTVTSAMVTSIAVSPSTASVPAGTSQQFAATGTFSDGSTQNISNSATWTSSSGSVATVDSAGLATTFSAGTANITATLGGVSGTAVLTISNAALQSIVITPANLQMATGTTAQLTATGSYSDGSSQDLTSTVTWTSAPASVASVDPSGIVSADKAGTTTITATFNGVNGTTKVTVANKVLQSLIVTPVNTFTAAGAKIQFTATANYADGTTQDLTTTVHWSTSSASIATINSGQSGGGLATAKAAGTVTITATLGAVSGSTTLTVN